MAACKGGVVCDPVAPRVADTQRRGPSSGRSPTLAPAWSPGCAQLRLRPGVSQEDVDLRGSGYEGEVFNIRQT